MSITKLKTLGPWSALSSDLTQVGSHLGGRRVITGLLTGSDGPLAEQTAEAPATDPRPGQK